MIFLNSMAGLNRAIQGRTLAFHPGYHPGEGREPDKPQRTSCIGFAWNPTYVGVTCVGLLTTCLSRDFPGRFDFAGFLVLCVFQRNAHLGEFVADAVGLREVLALAGFETCSDEVVNSAIIRRRPGP